MATMRVLRVVTAVAIGASTLLAACGLFLDGPEGNGGNEAGVDSTMADNNNSIDVMPNDVVTPMDASEAEAETSIPCTYIDASCLGDANIPDGWTLVGAALGDASCPMDFAPTSYVTQAAPADGGCVCAACQTQGVYSCNGKATVHAGNNCGNSLQVDAGDCTDDNHQSISATPPNISGSPTCTISNEAGTGAATANPATVCTPTKCEANYCGLPDAGFRRCIMTNGITPCPFGYNTSGTVGTGATLTSCTCACMVGNPPACTGTIQVYDNNGCGGGSRTYTANGNCNNDNGYSSYRYNSNAPANPTCTPNMPTPGTATAQLVAPKTVCCQ